MARARKGVCFHKLGRCGFCGIPRPLTARARRRCACCGRFMRNDRVEPSCPVCVERGFEALRLFPDPTEAEVAAAVAAQRALEEALAV